MIDGYNPDDTSAVDDMPDDTLAVDDMPDDTSAEDDDTSAVDDMPDDTSAGDDDPDDTSAVGDDTDDTDDTDDPDDPDQLREKFISAKRELLRLKSTINDSSSEKSDTNSDDLPPRPTLVEHGFDVAAYEAALDNWISRRDQILEKQKSNEVAKQRAAEEFKSKIQNYEKRRSALRSTDPAGYDIAELSVCEALTKEQCAMIVQLCSDAAGVIYAIGNSKKNISDLASSKGPVEFGYTLSTIERSMANKQPNNKPTKKISADVSPSSGSASGSNSNATLNRLRESAAASGDYSAVLAYRRKLNGKK